MKSTEFGIAVGLTVAAAAMLHTEWVNDFDPAQHRIDQVNACAPNWPTKAGKYDNYPGPGCIQTHFLNEYQYDFVTDGYDLPSRETFIRDNMPGEHYNVHRLEIYTFVSGVIGAAIGTGAGVVWSVSVAGKNDKGPGATTNSEESVLPEETKRRRKSSSSAEKPWEEELAEELEKTLFDSPEPALPAPTAPTRRRRTFGALATWFVRSEITRDMALDDQPAKQIDVAVRAMKQRKFDALYPPQD